MNTSILSRRQAFWCCQWALIVGAFLPTASAELPAAPTRKSVIATIDKALLAVNRDGESWRDDNQCISCHRIALTAWAFNRAAEAGITDAKERQRQWSQWVADWKHLVAPERREEATKEKTLLAENDAVTQLLLGRPSDPDIRTRQWLQDLRAALLKSQKPDGSWKAGGQLPTQKRPKRETSECSTMWAMFALLNTEPEPEDDAGKRATAQSIERALKWLGDDTRGQSTEWWAIRLLVMRSLGKTEQAEQSRQTLLGMQKENGGWGWLAKDPSDALGSGLVLFALQKDGMSPRAPEVAKGITFLQSTQRNDGTWLVHGTKRKGKDEEVETAVYWGVCWATLACIEWLERP